MPLSLFPVQDPTHPGAGAGTVDFLDPEKVQFNFDRIAAQFPLNGITGWKTVKDYGAIGDGVTDDHQAFVDGLAAEEVLFVPPGRYLFSSFTVPSGRTLFGIGWASQLVVSATPGLWPIYVPADATDVRMHSFSVDGNKANIPGNSDTGGAGVPATTFQVGGNDSAHPCQRIFLENIHLFNAKTLGMSLQNVQTGAVRNCIVRDNARDGITLYFNCRDFQITGNHIQRLADDGIGLNCEDPGSPTGNLLQRILVANNVITGPGVGQGGVEKGRGMTIRGGQHISVVGNQFVDTAQSAIHLGNYEGASATDILIAKNVIERPGYHGVSDKDGIRIDGNNSSGTISRVLVEGNMVRQAGEVGIRIDNNHAAPADDDIRGVTVRGNHVRESGDIGIGVSTGTGVNDIDIDDNLVSSNATGGIIVDAGALKRIYVRGNRVFRNTGYGIKMRVIAGGAIEGNQVYDDRSGGAVTQTHGINVFGLSGTFAFGGNTVWGHSTANYLNDGSHTATFQGPYLELYAGTTWNPANLADNAMETKAVTVTGAAVGDECDVSFDQVPNTGWVLSGQVTAANTVTAVLVNKTGGAVDLGSGSLRAFVRKYP